MQLAHSVNHKSLNRILTQKSTGIERAVRGKEEAQVHLKHILPGTRQESGTFFLDEGRAQKLETIDTAFIRIQEVSLRPEGGVKWLENGGKVVARDDGERDRNLVNAKEVSAKRKV